MSTDVYEAIDPIEGRGYMKGKGQEIKASPPTNAGGEEFSLSKCEAYGPVATPPDPTRVGQDTHYEVVQHSTSQV